MRRTDVSAVTQQKGDGKSVALFLWGASFCPRGASCRLIVEGRLSFSLPGQDRGERPPMRRSAPPLAPVFCPPYVCRMPFSTCRHRGRFPVFFEGRAFCPWRRDGESEACVSKGRVFCGSAASAGAACFLQKVRPEVCSESKASQKECSPRLLVRSPAYTEALACGGMVSRPCGAWSR